MGKKNIYNKISAAKKSGGMKKVLQSGVVNRSEALNPVA